MILIHHIGAMVVIVVGDPTMARISDMMVSLDTPEVIMLDRQRAEAMRMQEVAADLFIPERHVLPLLAVVPRRVRWLALLGADEHQHLVACLEQPLIQRRGIQPSPSWHAAMLARRHQSQYGEHRARVASAGTLPRQGQPSRAV